MTERLDDARVDALTFSPPEQTSLPLNMVGSDGSHEEMLLSATLGYFTPRLLGYLAGALLAREGIWADEIGIRYPDDELDEGEEPFEGVKLINPLGEVLVNLGAFERLMSRYLSTYAAWLEVTGDPVTRQPEFAIVPETATALARRASK